MADVLDDVFVACGARRRWPTVLLLAPWPCIAAPCGAQQWQQAVPWSTNAHAVYDVVAGRTRLFVSATKPAPHAETWDLAANVWRQRFPSAQPPDTGPAIYDIARARTVMVLGDPQPATWEFDGTNWSRATTTVAPSPRSRFSLSYDLARMLVVLFGGVDARGARNDTWEFDGTNWRQITPPIAPPPRFAAAMCFDIAHSAMVLFGGGISLPDPDQVLDDTWQFDGTAWTQVGVPKAPPARAGAAATFDVVRTTTVMCGGFDSNKLPLKDTWVFDGSKWTLQQTTHLPPERGYATMTYDWTRRCALLFGGSDRAGERTDTWQFDGTDWLPLRENSPPPRRDAAMVGDRAHGALLFGGNYEATVAETLTWDGMDWRRLQPRSSPSNRVQHGMVYDARRVRTVLFGGKELTGRLRDDTWVFDGADWRQLAPATAPAPRLGAAMAYDDDRDRIVLFGGATAGARVDETWEFDGAQWQLRRPLHAPRARDGARMVYDLARGRAVLFGGHDGVTPLADTWQYDGADWALAATPTSPPPRQSHTMSYDAHRALTVLFGGVGSAALGDLWEYDGHDWTAVAVGAGPDTMFAAVLAYDAQRRRHVLHGTPPGTTRRETWELLSPPVATFARYGRGCPGSGGVPTLDTNDGERPALGTTLPLVLGALPVKAGFAILGVAFEPTAAAQQPLDATGLPGCLLWITPAFDRVIAHNGTTVTVPMQVPFDPLLHGLEVGLQFVSFDTGAPGGLGALSNGALLVLQ